MGNEGEYYVESDDKCDKCGSTKFKIIKESIAFVEATTGRMWGDEQFEDESYRVVCKECGTELYSK